MGKNRTVLPTSTRLPLSDGSGDWIEVKDRLNIGDSKRLDAAGLKPPVLIDGKIFSPIDWGVYELERSFIFVTGWNLCGKDDQPLPLTLDSLKALDIETFTDINNLILKHTVEQARLKNQQKEAAAQATTEEPGKNTPASNEPSSAPTST